MAENLSIKLKDISSISSQLAKSRRLDDIIYDLKANGILAMEEYEDLLNLESTETHRCRLLISLLNKIENSKGAFASSLLKEGFDDLAKLVDPDLVQSICGRDPSCDFNNRLVELPNIQMPYLKYGLPTDDGGSFPISPECYYLAEEDNGPLKIKVCYSNIFNHVDNKYIYKNNSNPRGLVYLANYTEFNDKISNPTRRGSQVDSQNLTELFTHMGYQVQLHNDQNYRETIASLRAFQNNKQLNDVDCCIVIMMSHGYDDKTFYTSDDLKLETRKVIRMFNNDECPSMRGKPKIFIFQYCRGSEADMGVPVQPKLVGNIKNLDEESDGVSQGYMELSRDPEFFDTFIVNSCIEGFVSYRNPERGSWLIESICKEFMEHACDSDLIRLMNAVAVQIHKRSSNGRKQTSVYQCEGFVKSFYFNPTKLHI